MGREEASGETERGGCKVEAVNSYDDDFYWNFDYGHGSGVYGNESVSKWETS